MSSWSPETVFLFPGQGGYLPGALSRLGAGHPLPPVLGRVDAISLRLGGPRVSPLVTGADAPALDTLLAGDVPALSLAIFATELAVLELARDLAGVTPGLLVGHSFGEFAALTAAGALDLADGVRLVIARDRALRAAAGTDGGMVALGAGLRRVRAIVDSMADRTVAVAADNGYDQVVVSGPGESLDRVGALADVHGIEATRLRVPYPFHNRVLAEANRLFEDDVFAVAVRAPRTPVYSPVLGRYAETEQDVREVLGSHLERPVGFLPALVALRGDGFTRFLECGARGALTDLVRAALPAARTAAPLRQRWSADELRGEIAALADAPAAAGSDPATSPAVPAGGPARPATAPAPTGAKAEMLAAPGGPDVPEPRPAEPEAAALPVAEPEPVAPETAGVRPAEPDPAPGVNLLADLRSLYASAIGYPEEVFEAGVELEADLGIDSIRQTELLQRARRKYDVPEADHIRITDYTTLESIAGLLTDLGAGRVTA
ncbi:ACP S-malonyltransferase [Amycolatopsis sp. Hca4]|uniref:ACP S-malonyltransferase n=1 Tax=Amycolatopsis sp. Hca4 TaxID=2742131 RepID=UPI00158F9FBC|nr:acyltransferase domain-containing protein [Amycolatopsis sp. Hca4]QKV74028.1 acyltransferase domain-containing protein [Amycolatopsis sp. Hca4]